MVKWQIPQEFEAAERLTIFTPLTRNLAIENSKQKLAACSGADDGGENSGRPAVNGPCDVITL